MAEARASPQFSVNAAREAAAQGRLEAWVHAYLSSGEWADPAFVCGLRRQPRWWLGPVRIALASIPRICGPEPGLEYAQEPAGWEAKVSALAAEIADVALLPPFIAEYRDGTLSLRDGNHRHEALRRRGVTEFWAIVWCNSAADAEAARRRLAEDRRLAETQRVSTTKRYGTLHFVGTTIGLVCLISALATGNLWYLLPGLVAGYLFAWIGHFFFERNRPATFTYPLYSFMGDWVMWRDILTRKIKF